MSVTGPLSWLSLAGCILLICIGIFWSFRGEIPTTVHGQGILITQGAVHDVVSSANGRLEELRVQLNDTVRKGQVLARLSQPDLEVQIDEATAHLKDLEIERELIRSSGKESIALKRKYLREQRQALEKAVAFSEERLKALSERSGIENGSKRGGPDAVPDKTLDDRQKTIQEIIRHRNELSDISTQEADLASGQEKDLSLVQQRIFQTEAGLKALRQRLRTSEEFLSPCDGTVLEIFNNSGELIKAGESLLNLECAQEPGKQIGAFLYFSPVDGKKIRVGMRANITPSVVKKEEYGFILGEIHQVSGFPASRKGMLRTLQRENLVEQLSRGGAPILAAADLFPDPNTPSGFKWSSGLGPPLKIQSGTLCSAGVVIDARRPIDLVLPFLRRHLFGIGEENVRTAN